MKKMAVGGGIWPTSRCHKCSIELSLYNPCKNHAGDDNRQLVEKIWKGTGGGPDERMFEGECEGYKSKV